MMNKSSYQVSVIVVNYNTPFLLKDCIRSIYANTEDLHFEIIVVDNASNVNPAELLQGEFPNVKFIISPVNLGFGKANNLGVEQAKGEFLFFLNSDTILLNDAISVLYNFMKAHPEAGICGGNLYDDKQKPVHSYCELPGLWDEWKQVFSLKVGLSRIHNFSQHEKGVGYICGADLMINRQLFDMIGGFDKDFFLYYEETEMTYRCRQRGYVVYSVPQAKIIHYHGMSTTKKKDELRDWSGQEFLYSKFLYYRKTGRSNHPFYIKQMYLLKSFFAFCFYTVIGKQEKVVYWQNKRKIIHSVYGRYLAAVNNKN